MVRASTSIWYEQVRAYGTSRYEQVRAGTSRYEHGTSMVRAWYEHKVKAGTSIV
jgi:hypothetical protein